MKKFTVIALSGALALGLAACGSKEDSKDKEEKAKTEEVSKQEQTEKDKVKNEDKKENVEKDEKDKTKTNETEKPKEEPKVEPVKPTTPEKPKTDKQEDGLHTQDSEKVQATATFEGAFEPRSAEFNVNGKTMKFIVEDSALLKSLKPNAKVTISYKTDKVGNKILKEVK